MLLLSKFKIEGHSMEPKLRNGEKVLVSFISYLFNKPKVNDIILFKINDIFYIKRIKQKKNNKFIVAGDNGKDSFDSKSFGNIYQNQIIAKVIYKI